MRALLTSVQITDLYVEKSAAHIIKALSISWAEIPGGGGDGGTRPPPPHDFEGGGHNIKCPPPPPPRFCGRTIKNRIFNKICLIFVCFLFYCLSECRSRTDATGTPNLKKIVNADGAAEKKVSESPPAHQLIWELRDYGLAAVRKQHYVPPIIRFGFPPLLYIQLYQAVNIFQFQVIDVFILPVQCCCCCWFWFKWHFHSYLNISA